MKSSTSFSIIFFISAVALIAQSERQTTDYRPQAAGMNHPSSSPLMMFSEEEEALTPKTLDSRSAVSRDVSPRGATTTDSSSDTARGTASGKGDFEQERSAYEAAEEAWNDIVVPYETALDVAADAKMDISEIITFLHAAQANELYWKANLIGIEARKKEGAITSSPAEAQSSEMASAWATTVIAYEAALAKAKEAAVKSSEWVADLTRACPLDAKASF